MRCIDCLNLNSTEAKDCYYCGTILSISRTKSFIGKLREKIGFESMSGIITLSLEEPERFFSSEEIDSLVSLEKVKPLAATEVPNWEIMFFTSKRVRKPVK